MSYNRINFEGQVTTKNGVYVGGRSWFGFAGKVSILEGKDMLGFDVKDDSNWVARIESADGSRSVNLPGCQVQSVLQGAFELSPTTLEL